METRVGWVSAGVAAIVGCAGAALAQSTTGVSLGLGGAPANGASLCGIQCSSTMSADGRHVAFKSVATDLVAGDTNGVSDVFVHDRAAGVTTRVSVSTGGGEANGPSNDGFELSDDGRWIAFDSDATNLVAGDTNGVRDVFLHDRTTGETTRVSVDSDGGQAHGPSGRPVLSADGRYVAYSSEASDLVPGDTNGRSDAFLYDRTSGQTIRASVGPNGEQGNDLSGDPSLSADGRYMAFMTAASNFFAPDVNLIDIARKDLVTGAVEPVTLSSSGVQALGQCYMPSISSDGARVAFVSQATNLVAGDTNGSWDVFVRDLPTQQLWRASVGTAGTQGNHHSWFPHISGDGGTVAFASVASNLVPDDTNGFPDVFVRALASGTTQRVSLDSSGAQGNSYSGAGVQVGPWYTELGLSISADGSTVAFGSQATNLVAGDSNGVADVFVRASPGPHGIAGWGPVRFDSWSSKGPFVQVSAHGYHTLALRPDGTVASWGSNYFGECEPPPLAPGLAYAQVDGGKGWFFSVARLSDGSVIGWGNDFHGITNVPTLPAGLTYVHVAAGSTHVAALRSDGAIVAWGNNQYGQCNVPALPAGLAYVEVDAYAGGTAARRSDGAILAWGYNADGQLGVPPLPPGLTYVGVGVGYFHILALRSDGALVAWGYNVAGQCNVPPLPPGLAWVEVTGGAEHSLGRRSDGSVVAWGSNSTGQCDVPTLPPGLSFVQLAAGGEDAIWGQFRGHSVALLSDGSAIGWGHNEYLQCSLPPLAPGLFYTEVSAGGTNSSQLYTAPHFLARVSDGTVRAFGRNVEGQCNVPAPPTGTFYVEVDAGGHFYSLARRNDGVVVGWGDNTYGQRNVPALPLGLSYVEVAAGARHALGRRNDGTLIAWGDNGFGQCNVPALPPGLAYVEVAASWRHSVARRSDGSVVAWGSNAAGQCDVPPLPPGLAYVEVAAGYESTLARRSDGTIVAWGDNGLGQCDVPALPRETSYVEIAAGAEYPGSALRSNTLARRSDGALVVWGDTSSGQADVPPFPIGTSPSEIAAGGLLTVVRLGEGATCPSPVPYCVAKQNSLGCTPSIGWQGLPTQSGTDDFWVTASNVRNNKLGVLLWGLSPATNPFFGGTLCLAQPIHRTDGQLSGGSPVGDDCSGTYAFHFSQVYMLQSLLAANTTVYAQYWSRDPGFPPPYNVGLTDALRFTICP